MAGRTVRVKPAWRRTWNMVFLPPKLEQYLESPDWTGRPTRPDKRGQVPGELLPILERCSLCPLDNTAAPPTFSGIQSAVLMS